MTDWKPAMRVPDPAVRVLDERFRHYEGYRAEPELSPYLYRLDPGGRLDAAAGFLRSSGQWSLVLSS